MDEIFLTQGMPETIIKTLEKLIQNFAWSGKNKPTISMAHMSASMEAGRKKVLDIHTRNEAIQLTWVQSYLKMDEMCPTWAYLADEILRNDIPSEQMSLLNTLHVRVQFLWLQNSKFFRLCLWKLSLILLFPLEFIKQTPPSLPSFPFILWTKHRQWAMTNYFRFYSGVRWRLHANSVFTGT